MERKNTGYRLLALLEDRRPAKLRRRAWVLPESYMLEALEKGSENVFVKRLLLLAAVSGLLIIAALAAGLLSPGLEEALKRPPYGSEAGELSLELEMSLGKQQLSETVDVLVQPERLGAAAADKMFDELWEQLPGIMYEGLLSSVSGDLKLPQEYGEGRVRLFWESSAPSVVYDDGFIDFLEASQGQRISLVCSAEAGDFTDRKEFTVIIDKASAELEKSFQKRMELLSLELSASDSGLRLELPEEAAGARLDWRLSKGSAVVPLILISALLGLFLYFSRYDSLEKKLKSDAEAFRNELPNMILQLILLLNAGLVSTAAFEELLEQNKKSSNPLYIQLRLAMQRCKGSNSSFSSELYSLARRSESKEFIRFANLVYENSARGTQLAEKLERERSSMWNSRLNMAKARAKTAETKLSFPLLLLLLSVVMISIAPAFLQMNT